MIIYQGKELLSKAEFASMIGVSYNKVTRLVEKGFLIPVETYERSQFFSQEQVNDYLNGKIEPIRRG